MDIAPDLIEISSGSEQERDDDDDDDDDIQVLEMPTRLEVKNQAITAIRLLHFVNSFV